MPYTYSSSKKIQNHSRRHQRKRKDSTRRKSASTLMGLRPYRSNDQLTQELIFISGNEGKIKELSSILSPNRVTNRDIDLPEIQTTEVEEVVKEKVMTAWNEVKSPLFVEDTGLYITSPPMNGFPGALIKFYFKKLGVDGISEINGNNLAYAESVIGYHDGNSVHIFKGSIQGKIASKPQHGLYGFGWDAIFIPTENNPNNLSFAQMSPMLKDSLSMRRIAGENFKNYLLANNRR